MPQQNIICLDFDDCILPHPLIPFIGINESYSYSEFAINLSLIKAISEKIGADIFITSSWYSHFEIIDNKLSYVDDYESYGYLPKVKDIFNEYLDCHGISCGNRIRDIEQLSKKYETVIVIDDMSFVVDETNTVQMDVGRVNSLKNVYIMNVFGRILNRDLVALENFFNNK